MDQPRNVYEEQILKALKFIEDWSDKTCDAPSTPEEKEDFPKEDPRLIAILRTKLQEALLIAGVVYNPKRLEPR